MTNEETGWTEKRLPSGEVEFEPSEAQRFSASCTSGCFTLSILAAGALSTWWEGRIDLFGGITLGVGFVLLVALLRSSNEVTTWRVGRGVATQCVRKGGRTRERVFRVDHLLIRRVVHSEGTTTTLSVVGPGQQPFTVFDDDLGGGRDVVAFGRAFAQAAGVRLEGLEE